MKFLFLHHLNLAISKNSLESLNHRESRKGWESSKKIHLPCDGATVPPPPPPPSRLNNIMIAFLSKTSCHRNLRKERRRKFSSSARSHALRASDPSLRSVNRPIGPWLLTHDEATRVLWHREGRTFFERFFALPGFPVAKLRWSKKDGLR